MNVLILSAAAKVPLVRAFKAAGATVLAADLGPDNAALFEADKALILPRSDDPAFIDALAAACADHDVRLIVPTRDAELPVLAAAELPGVTVLAPAPEVVETCQDKRRFVAFCAEHGFATPKTYAAGETPTFPVFVRPARGAGARGARRIDAAEPFGPDDLVQELQTDPEFSVDVLMDLAGRLLFL